MIYQRAKKIMATLNYTQIRKKSRKLQMRAQVSPSFKNGGIRGKCSERTILINWTIRHIDEDAGVLFRPSNPSRPIVDIPDLNPRYPVVGEQSVRVHFVGYLVGGRLCDDREQ